MKKVTLILSDGTQFHGESFGFDAPVAGEVVFNTAMMGYPESLTDPSYAGQLMVLTYPLVGNYGVPPFTFGGKQQSIRPEDLNPALPDFMESDRIYASAIIVADYSERFCHWNAVESLGDWLKREHIPGITGIDTRELTKVLRAHGVGKVHKRQAQERLPLQQHAGLQLLPLAGSHRSPVVSRRQPQPSGR